MSETTILNYELGYMPIAYDKAKRLAKALEIDEKLLFDDYCRFLDYPFQLRCKELRLELGLTQFEIADKAGIARGTYGTWECAAVRPGREPFQKIASFITSQRKEVAYPYVAFAQRDTSGGFIWISQPEWLQLPEGSVRFLSPSELTRDWHDLRGELSSEELEQIHYWNPQTVGEIVFNTWD